MMSLQLLRSAKLLILSSTEKLSGVVTLRTLILQLRILRQHLHHFAQPLQIPTYTPPRLISRGRKAVGSGRIELLLA